MAAQFNRIRQEVLCRPRDTEALAAELREMRLRMNREHEANEHLNVEQSPKHQPGGLIDIEFIAQFGVLSSARLYPRVIRATGTVGQLQELNAIGWLSRQEYDVLTDCMRRARLSRMLSVLLPQSQATESDAEAASAIFASRLGGPDRADEAESVE